MNACKRRSRWPQVAATLIFALALPLVAITLSRAQGVDPFAAEFKRADAPTKLPDAKEIEKAPPPEDNIHAISIKQKMTLSASIAPKSAKRGEIVTVTITGIPKTPKAHTYSALKRHATQTGGTSQLQVTKADGAIPLFPIRESEIHVVKKEGETSYELPEGFTWSLDLLVPEDAPPGKKSVAVQVKMMACDDGGCTFYGNYDPLRLEFDVADGPAAAPPADWKQRTEAPKLQIVEDGAAPAKGTVPPKGNVPAVANPAPNVTGVAEIRHDLTGLLGAAALGAFLMLLTPCVFPMIPITVNFFIKQSEKEHHKPFKMAAVYAGTIVVMLSAVMLVLGNFVILMANNEWFNLGLGAVLVLFALSLFGMYEIELPHFLSRFTSQREGQGGLLGTIFMALTFTITSFTCTGPFLGIMLAPVAGLQPPKINLILAALVYSTTFAAPFFLLALFPTVLKKLPKGGGWMNVIKVTMGFLELGAALKFLANFDLGLNPGNPRVFNYDTVLCAWIALSLATALYLFGMFRLPHDDPAEHIGAFRMVFGTVFFGLALYMVPLLVGITPKGIVMEAIVAFLPPNFDDEKALRGSGPEGESKHLTWHLDYEDAWKEAKETGKLIFIDFTGQYCTNCRDNEKNVFTKKEVVEALRKYVRLQLYTDVVPNPKLSAAEAGQQKERNVRWQVTIADLTLPSYVIWNPDRTGPFVDGKLKGNVVDKRNGKIFDVPDFVRFVQDPVKNQPGPVAQADGKVAWHNDYHEAWKRAKAEKKKLFVDFTGQKCPVCVDNARNVLSKRETKNLLQEFVCVHLYTDEVPGMPQSKAKDQGNVHFRWQVAIAKTLSRPTYVVMEPSDSEMENGVPNGTVLAVHAGTIWNAPEFNAMLAKAK